MSVCSAPAYFGRPCQLQSGHEGRHSGVVPNVPLPSTPRAKGQVALIRENDALRAEVERLKRDVEAATEDYMTARGALSAEVAALREALWLRHGCDVGVLYGDDGEMQCGMCRLDFKRDSIAQIVERWRSAAQSSLSFVREIAAATALARPAPEGPR